MWKILRKPILSAEMGGKGCQKSCDVWERAENIGEPRKSLLCDKCEKLERGQNQDSDVEHGMG